MAQRLWKDFIIVLATVVSLFSTHTQVGEIQFQHSFSHFVIYVLKFPHPVISQIILKYCRNCGLLSQGMSIPVRASWYRCIPGAGVLTLAALGVVCAQTEEARLTSVTASAIHVWFATTLAGHQSKRSVCVTVAHPTVQGTVRVTVTCWETSS